MMLIMRPFSVVLSCINTEPKSEEGALITGHRDRGTRDGGKVKRGRNRAQGPGQGQLRALQRLETEARSGGGTTGHRGEGEGTALPSNNLHLRYTASLEQSVSFLSQLPLNTPQYVQRIPGNDFFANVCLLRLLREKDVIHFL